MGVWEAHSNHFHPAESRAGTTDALDRNRKDECFFYEAKEGMSLKSAETLERRQREQKHLKTTRRISVCALAVSVFALAKGLLWP